MTVTDEEKEKIHRNTKFISDNFKCGELRDITGNIVDGQHYIEVVKSGG